jgi:hypothetical protein
MIHFGDDLDADIIGRATEESRKADVMFALGSYVLWSVYGT